MDNNYDFSGWATKNDLRCGDGRTIRKDAFKDNDGQIVPLVWNHQHNDVGNVVGHALLMNKPEGVYTYGYLNDTQSGQDAKELIYHGDITSLSIYANQLKQDGGDVLHGSIREVSLVLAGSNPGACIDNVVRHGEDSEEEAFIYTGEELVIKHAEEEKPAKEEAPKEEAPAEAKESEKTVGDIIKSMNDEQRNVLYALVGQALEEDPKTVDKEVAHSDDNNEEENIEEDSDMKHNLFENEETTAKENVISHSDMMAVINDAKRYGSMKESALAHGIEDVDYLFPEAHTLNTPPEFIKRDMGWVSKVMSGVHHTPFSRIKSMFANITEDDARAKGYIKGNLKKEEVFSLLKRTTTPTTVYKKQKMDRDDVVDITDFDVIAWLKSEMRMMLDEELARAYLVGDGRLASSDDKINADNIRPIAYDEALYTIKTQIQVESSATDNDKARALIKGIIKARKDYKGSGEPTFYTTEDVLTDCLLIEDATQRIVYDSVDKLAHTLRVKEIVTVPVMENLKGANGGDLLGIIVNLADYNVGADKGGAVNLFEDFDIDYNQQKYLIETRCSGALTKPYSAIAVELVENA